MDLTVPIVFQVAVDGNGLILYPRVVAAREIINSWKVQLARDFYV